MAHNPPGIQVAGIVSSCQVFGVFVRLDPLPEVPALLEVIPFAVIEADSEHRIEFPADYPRSGRDRRPASWAGSSSPGMCGSLNWATRTGATSVDSPARMILGS